MPRKRSDEVIVDPVAAARQLEPEKPEPEKPEPEKPEPVQVSREVKCALGHRNAGDVSFCGTCGLAIDAPAPAKVSLEDARPKPAGQLTEDERAARERQHAESLAAARQFEEQPVVYQPSEGETVLIHFIEDGLTFAGQVWYRGQEIEIGPSHPRWEQARGWILLDRYAQIDRYGKQYFERGPWPGRRSYLDGIDGYEQLATQDGRGRFAGPGEQALREADERERRRGRAVPAPSGQVSPYGR